MRPVRDYRPIRDYAIIGDGHTAALVAGDGSIDWCCWPRFDSGAVFCSLLDSEKGGFFQVAPEGRYAVSRSYAGETNVLVSRFSTDEFAFRLTDFMPIEKRPERRRGKDLDPSHRILRLLEGIHGKSRVNIVFRPTFDYARAKTEIRTHARGASARDGHEALSLSCPSPFQLDENGIARSSLEIPKGGRVWIALAYSNDVEAADAAVDRADRDLRQTLDFWNDWIGACRYEGPYAGMVRRSALALKSLIFSPSGAMVAAPTTSLPEEIGGSRNWDYRYAWLRDSGLLLQALETIGYYDEALNFFRWMEDLDLQSHGRLQIMYTIDGSPELPERSLAHLQGYRRSGPVRIGNGASNHVQLDTYGEVLEAAYICFHHMKQNMSGRAWKMITELADGAAENWIQDDRSIWEMRGEPRPYLYSKLLCWVALDRAIRLADELHLPANTAHWRSEAGRIRHAILERGYNNEAGAFTQAFGSKSLDASLLAVPRVGFLAADDPRVVSTTERIREELSANGLVYRYLVDDGLPGREGAFTTCSFWLIENLARLGRVDEARSLFEHVARYASDLGLFSEEVDPGGANLLGNYPQDFTHLALIRAAINIASAERARGSGRTSSAGRPGGGP